MKVTVRLAQQADIPYVRRLAQESILYTIPYGRTTANSAVQARVREALRELGRLQEVQVLVATLAENGKLIGYLILQLDEPDDTTGDRQSYIYDLAVEKRYWGTPAVRLLVQEAARCTARAGLSYMSGEISAHNERTYLQALRLGFELERMRIVMACDENGPAPLPERPIEDRAYAASRKDRHDDPATGLPMTYGQVRKFRARTRLDKRMDS